MDSDADLLVTSGQYADVLKRRKYVVLVGVVMSLLFAALVFAVTGGDPSLAAAEATVEVQPVTANRFGTNTRLRDLVSMPTEVEVMQSSAVAQRVIDRLGIDTTAERLLTDLAVENPDETLVLRIEFTSQTEEFALSRAQAFAEEYLAFRTESLESTISDSIAQVSVEADLVREDLAEALNNREGLADGTLAATNLDARIAQLNLRLTDFEEQIAGLQGIFVDPGAVVSDAKPVVTTAAPGWITAAGAFGLGIIAAIAAAVAVDRLDERPRDEQEITGAIPAPVFGVQHVERGDADEAGGVRNAKARRMLGEYRRLRLLLDGPGGEIRSLLVTTPVDDNAAGEVATNLARVVAKAQERVVLVWNEDVRRNALDEMGVKVTTKLDDVLVGRRSIDEVLAEVPGQPGMTVVGLSVGQTTSIAAGKLREAYADLLERADLVITVGPAASPADTAEIAAFVEASVIALDSQHATRASLRRVVSTLDAVGNPVIAAFVTRSRPWW